MLTQESAVPLRSEASVRDRGDVEEDLTRDQHQLTGNDCESAATSSSYPPETDTGGDTTNAYFGVDGRTRRRRNLGRVVATGVLPGVAVLLAVGAGYLKWVDFTAHDIEVARAQSVQAAVESTVAMLSYRPDTVEQNLAAARDRMTGSFRDSYTSLTHDFVVPGAKQKSISAVATVPAAASVSATETHAVVLLFVNQSTTIGSGPPTDTASSVKVTLDKVQNRWLISQFDPI